MKVAPLPQDEHERLQALSDYHILDTMPEPEFDDLTHLASQICQTPIALISFIDPERQWLKSKVGITVNEFPRNIAFCSHTTLENHIFVVLDALTDQRFADNPLVTKDPHIRFYAGVPLLTKEGHALGTLCVIDRVPRDLDLDVQEALRALARQVMALLGLRLHIGKLEQVQKDLRKSEERFDLAVKGTNDGIWDWMDVNRDHEWWSPHFYRLLGFHPSEVPASLTKFKELLHPDDHERTFQAVQDHFKKKYPFDLEYRLRTKSGEYRWFHGRGDSVRDEAGRPLRMVGSIQDITVQKQTELDLIERNHILALDADIGRIINQKQDIQPLLQGCTEAVVRNLDAALARIWTLNSAEQILELQASAGLYTHLNGFHGRVPLGQLKIGKIALERQAHLTNAVIGDPRIPEQEWARREGLVAFAGYPLMRGGKVLGVLAMFSKRSLMEYSLTSLKTVADRITTAIERHAAESELLQQSAELARSNADLQQFASVASHDLQEPLRMVSSYTQLLGKRYTGKLDADADEFIRYAVDGASRMQILIRDLLEYSRVGKGKLHLTMVDSAEVFRQAVKNLQVLIDERRAQIVWNDLPCIKVDLIRLTQVVQNLLANAIKFCDASTVPCVTVRAEPREADWLFSVQDNGIGIESAYMNRIFEVFQRLHNRKTYSGTGIGLAICKRIVEDHGGQIWVESTPGVGSTFFFTIAKS